MDVANAMFLTIPGIMLFACGYLIRYHDIKAWLKWCVAALAAPCESRPHAIRTVGRAEEHGSRSARCCVSSRASQPTAFHAEVCWQVLCASQPL